jgi:UDP-3-O-[3-hydroxymyristoyl] glucosamine N-acyltransferase
MKRTLFEIAEAVGARLIGDGSIVVGRVASIDSASPEDLVFVEDEKYLAAALQSKAGAVIVPDSIASSSTAKPLIVSNHPKLAFARAARLFHDSPTAPHAGPPVHPTAVIHESAWLAPGVVVEERAVIGAGVKLGEHTRIGCGCVIADGVSIGTECRIYPNVTIYAGTTLGDRVIVHAGGVLGSDGFGYVRDRKTGRYEKFPQVGRLVIEADVEIGANTTIDRGALDETRIRRGVKIDNLVHIGHNCDIGEDVVIAAQTGVSGSAVIENGAIVGGQVGIADHVRIGEGAILGAQAGVPSNKIVRGKGVVFWGTPARPIKQYLKQLAQLARLAKEE